MGTKPISDKKRKLIVADYSALQNYSEVARKHGISPNGVKKIVQRDPVSAELCEQKQQENTQSVLEYLDGLSELKKEIMLDILKGIQKKAKDLDMFTNIKDLGTTYGILADKELKLAEMHFLKATEHQKSEIDKLSKSLMELAGELDGD